MSLVTMPLKSRPEPTPSDEINPEVEDVAMAHLSLDIWFSIVTYQAYNAFALVAAQASTVCLNGLGVKIFSEITLFQR
jgi:hypothetical protein